MPTPTSAALTETIAHAIAAADRHAGDWALVLYDARYPPGRVPGGRATKIHPPAPAGDPDHIDADRWDPGIGSHAGREACARAVDLTMQAWRLAEAAAVALGRAPAATAPRRPVDAQGYRRAVYAAAARLRWATGHGLHTAPDDTRRAVHAGADHLLQAHRAVRGRLRDFDGVGELPAEARCWNCGRAATRPRTGECEACSRYRRRAEDRIRRGLKVERRYRPAPRWQDAHDARRRRQARLLPGQLDIEGPLPRGVPHRVAS